MHFIIPFVEQVVQLEVRTLKYQAEATAASNDLQQVTNRDSVKLPSEPMLMLMRFTNNWAQTYADRVIAPTIQESVKASVAKYNAEELITKNGAIV